MTIRRATSGDVAVIAGHRRAMFVDMGHRNEAVLDAMVTHFVPWLKPRIESGEYLAWLAVEGNQKVVAGLGLWLMDWLPHMHAPESARGNIVNVYTEQEYRRRGLARQLMQTALDWCRDNGVRTVILHASQEGRPLYESLGFQPTNELRLNL